MTDRTFPKQQYTSIETAELDRLHARIAELEQTERNKAFEHGKKLGEQVLDNRRLLNELDKLRPLEFLLKREGSVTQQMHEKLIELTRKLRDMERGKGPTPGYTGEGSAWVPPVEARGVVVSELTDEDYFRLVQSITCPRGTESVGQLLTEFVREHSRAISADRLGEGMVAVDSLLYAALINLEKAVVREWGLCCTGDRLWNGQKAIADRRDALRANQGGAAT